MKILYHIFILMFIIGAKTAYSQTLPEQFKEKVASQTKWIDGSHQINYDGNTFTVNIANKKLTSIHASIFHDNMYGNINRNILNYIEEAYANYLLNANDSRFNDFYFQKGSWKNFKTFNKNTSFTLSNDNSQSYTVTWNTNDSIVILTFPVGYDKTNKGTRSEIENRYIDGLKHFIVKAPRHIPHTTISDLKQIRDSIYVLPGNTYVINSVSNDSYFTINKKKNQTELIMDAMNPVPTIANMIVIGNGFEGNLELKISKHEYGKSEIINIPLEAFIQYNITNGCDVFWGLDSFNSNMLKGTIFCYNSNEGYDHIIRIEVNTSQLGSNKLTIKGYASLFVPTNNIQNLFQDKK